MGGKSSKNQTVTTTQDLDPSVRRAVDFLTSESIDAFGGPTPGAARGIGITSQGDAASDIRAQGDEILALIRGEDTPLSGELIPASRPGSLVPDLSPDTLAGLDLLRNQFADNQGADVLSRTVGGGFQGANPFAGSGPGGGGNDLSDITRLIQDAATKSVGDRFSQAGRTGSPGEGLAIGGEVARNLAPFAFGARESALNRELVRGQSALGRGFGAFEAERGRQLGAIPGLFGVQSQGAQNLLNVGQTLEEQQRLQALEPFQKLQLIQGPLATAISGAPPTQQISQPTSRNALAGGLGGAAIGGSIGGAIGGAGASAAGGAAAGAAGGSSAGPIGAGIGGLLGLLGFLG